MTPECHGGGLNPRDPVINPSDEMIKTPEKGLKAAEGVAQVLQVPNLS